MPLPDSEPGYRVTVKVSVPDIEGMVRLKSQPWVLWTALSARFMELFNRNWEAQGGLWGKWKPIAESTRMLYGNRPPLSGTQLRQSFRADVRDDGFTFGSPLPHALYHQEGRKGPWKILPRKAKALSFPWPYGRSLQAVAAAKGGQISIERAGAQTFRVGRGPLVGTASFQSGANRKMSMRNIASQNRGVFAGVTHPGYPARPMLPSQADAEKFIAEAYEAFIEWYLKKM